MKKVFAAVLCSAAFLAGAGEEYDFDKLSAWKPVKNVTSIGEDHLLVKGRALLESKQLFDINPDKVYKIELEAKRVGSVSSPIYFGFDLYRADGKTRVRRENIEVVPGTECTVAAAAQKGDTVVYLDKDAGKWKKYDHTYIALNAKKDLSDLPNYKVIRFSIKSIEKTAEGYKITLTHPLSHPIAKGANVRQHLTGGYMYTAGYRYLNTDRFIKMQGRVTGQLPGAGYNFNVWSKYAAKARLIVLVNWHGKASETELKDIELEIEDKK